MISIKLFVYNFYSIWPTWNEEYHDTSNFICLELVAYYSNNWKYVKCWNEIE